MMMQKVVIAGALAVLTSGAAVPLKARAEEKHFAKRGGVRAKELAVREAWSKDNAKTGMTVEAKLETEGESLKKLLEHQSGKKYFEMTYGQFGCETTGGDEWYVEGYEMHSCKDYLWRYDEDGDLAHAESRMYVAPWNGGWPIGMWFKGHGCKTEPESTWRMDKQDDYFPTGYKPGTCVQVDDDDDWANGQAYYGQASWTDEKHVPVDGTRMWGDNTKERACSKNRFYEYEFWRYSSDCRGYWEEDRTENCLLDIADLVDFDPTDNHYMSIEFTTNRCVGFNGGLVGRQASYFWYEQMLAGPSEQLSVSVNILFAIIMYVK